MAPFRRFQPLYRSKNQLIVIAAILCGVAAIVSAFFPLGQEVPQKTLTGLVLLAVGGYLIRRESAIVSHVGLIMVIIAIVMLGRVLVIVVSDYQATLLPVEPLNPEDL